MTPKELKEQIARADEASQRLDKARAASIGRDISNAVDYIHGWIAQGAENGFGLAPDELLTALARYIEGQNAKVKRNPRLARDNEYFRSLRNLDVLARWRERENARRKI